MTEVFYKINDSERFEYIIIKNHTNYRTKGKDIVCSGISAIVNGAVNFLLSNYRESCKIKWLLTKVTINCPKGNFPDSQLCLKMMIYQLKNIADFYPDYLKLIKD